nr:hypothetical protein [Tanacetum cinerariifolium]
MVKNQKPNKLTHVLMKKSTSRITVSERLIMARATDDDDEEVSLDKVLMLDLIRDAAIVVVKIEMKSQPVSIKVIKVSASQHFYYGVAQSVWKSLEQKRR